MRTRENVRDLADIAANVISADASPWRAPEANLIGSALPDAPDLPLSLFGRAGDYLKRAGLGANVKPDYVAGMLLAAIGGLIGKTYQVRISDDWFAPFAVWVMLVGPPSSGKTPACKAIRRKLAQLQKELIEMHNRLIEGDILEAEQRDASPEEINSLRESLKTPPRYTVNDSTSEALARVEARSPRGLLIERDELAGLLEALERYSAGVDRAYYLEGFDSGSYTLDRVKAGTIIIGEHCFSICGGIQPDRLMSLLIHSGDDDGFAARNLIFWPDQLPPGGIPNGANHTAMEAALERIEALPGGENEGKVTVTLEPDAFAVLNDWHEKNHGKRVGTGGKIGSAFGKLPGYAGRLAGLLHMADWAFDPASGDFPLSIPERHVVGALTLIESYFVPQIRRAYHGTDSAPADALAGTILRECKKRGLRSFNLRTARRTWGLSGARTKNAPALFKSAAEVLMETGWVIAKRSQGGSSDYDVNPALFTMREA